MLRGNNEAILTNPLNSSRAPQNWTAQIDNATQYCVHIAKSLKCQPASQLNSVGRTFCSAESLARDAMTTHVLPRCTHESVNGQPPSGCDLRYALMPRGRCCRET